MKIMILLSTILISWIMTKSALAVSRVPDFRLLCANFANDYNMGDARSESFSFKNYHGDIQTADLKLKMLGTDCVANNNQISFVVFKSSGAGVTTHVTIEMLPTGLLDAHGKHLSQPKIDVTTSDCVTQTFNSIKNGSLRSGIAWNSDVESYTYRNVAEEFCPKYLQTVQDSLIRFLIAEGK